MKLWRPAAGQGTAGRSRILSESASFPVAVTEDGPSSGAGEVAAAAEEATEAAGDEGGFKANVGMYRYCGGGGAAPGSFS